MASASSGQIDEEVGFLIRNAGFSRRQKTREELDERGVLPLIAGWGVCERFGRRKSMGLIGDRT